MQKKGVLQMIAMVLPSLFALLIWGGNPAVATHQAGAGPDRPEPGVMISVKSSPEASLESVLSIYSKDLSQSFRRVRPEPYTADQEPEALYEDVEITVPVPGGQSSYFLTDSGRLVDRTGQSVIKLPKRQRRDLLQYSQKLRGEHYGEYISWEEAERVLPKYAKVSVMDLETGLRFNAQRRAGSRHADMQPLTRQDTKLMKQIYNGAWSWKRRAVLVMTEGRILAASMHGMPHGGDGIPDNGFSGHFCIHFPGSTTHGSGALDLAHQAMAHKAAGRLNEYVRSLTPYQLVDLYLLSINQKDPHLLKKTLSATMIKKGEAVNAADPAITMVRRLSSFDDESDTSRLTSMTIPVRIALYRQNHSKETQALSFTVIRASKSGGWKIDTISKDA